jgi:hypothetical protein
MKKQTALRVLNPVLFLLVIYQGVTGFFRMNMYTHFQAVHPIVGALLIAVAIVHLALNWPWVRSQYFPGRNRRGAMPETLEHPIWTVCYYVGECSDVPP